MKLELSPTPSSDSWDAWSVGDPWLLLSADRKTLTVGFEYSRGTIELPVDLDDDHAQRLTEWADSATRKISGARPIYAGGYKGWSQLPQANDANAEEMFREDGEDWSDSLCIVHCPTCGRAGKPLLRANTFYVGGGRRWVGLDHREPHSDYRTSCNFCHGEFRFTIFTPQ